MPSLDNGQLSWALATVVAGLEDSELESDRSLAAMAQSILLCQNYRIFYNSEKKLLHGTIQYDDETGQWYGDQTYYLNDMFEGTMAVLWAVLHGQIPEDAWYNLAIPTSEYTTAQGETITTLSGFRASFHEHWALGFLPVMDSALAPLYQNFLYTQADYARKNNLPGFLSTAYDPHGVYRVAFRLKAADPTSAGRCVSVDVNTRGNVNNAQAQQTLQAGQFSFPPRYERFCLPFLSPREGWVDFPQSIRRQETRATRR